MSMTTTTEREPLPRGFWVIWSTVALDMVGFGIVAPILGRYADRFGASGLQVGLLFASFSLAQMICAPMLGRLSDRVGRKPVIIVSLIGTAVGSFVTGIAGALWVLFVGRIIDGASGASIAVAQSAVVDLGKPEQRARMLGLLGMAFGVGFVVGPALGGLAALGGPHVPFFVASGLAAANAIAAVIRLPETSTTVRQPRSPSRRVRQVNRFIVIGFFSALPFAGFEATFSLFGGARFDLTEGSTAAVFFAIGLAMSLVQGMLIGPLTKRFGSTRLLQSGLVLVACGLGVLGGASVWVVLFVALALIVIGSGVSNPSLTTLVANSAPADQRGEVLGFQQSAGALARVIGPPLAGLSFDRVGIGAPYSLGALVFLIAIVASWQLTTSRQ
ncbi:MAG: MFS transporter [Actinobacteria bacterium]|nr:MFS transporter [Actinomycetota bacterium]NBT37379.1 MFS transporter [Actinomycetota bacterium]NBY12204.1 MFS transporter [Actinomycetota bacterium]NCZ89732.1 MFS transporter [Actinomycetota bacterium]NCZ90886.1 MFS transporter [Actinomycetota bacterium]